MPFPASPSNNDVHKVGNRAFTYDSTLGTWDQVREVERTENNLLSGEIGGAVTGTIGSGVTFPAGHVLQTKMISFNAAGSSRNMNTSTTYLIMDLGQGPMQLGGITMTQGNLCHCTLGGMNWMSETDNTYSTFIQIWDGSAARFTYEFYSDQNSGEYLQMPISLNFVFSVPASFSNKTLAPRVRHQDSRPSGGSYFSSRTTLEDCSYFFMVQEIQQ